MRDRFEDLLAAWGRLIYRRAWLTIGLVLAVTAGLGTQLVHLRIETSPENFLREDDPSRRAYNAFREQFGRDEMIILAVETPDVFTVSSLEKLRALQRDIESEVPKLTEVTSLVNARNTRGEGDELIVEELLERWPETPQQLAALRERVLANPLYVDIYVSRDARVAAIVIETEVYSSIGVTDDALLGFDDESGAAAAPPAFLTADENSEIVRAVDAVVARHDAPDFRIHAAGSPTMMDYMMRLMTREMTVFTALSILSIAAILSLLFQRLAGVALPLVVVILAVTCTFSAMSILGIVIDVPTQILPSFLLAVGVCNSVHVLSIFFQRLGQGADKESAIAFALGHAGLAVVMTSLTTAGGLVSFAAAELVPVADFGIAAPIGVLTALAFTLTLLPAMIAVFPIRARGAVAPGAMRRFSQRAVVGMGTFGIRYSRTITVATAGLVAIALLGAFQLRFSHDILNWFPEGNRFRVASEFADERLNGAMSFELLVDSGRDGGLKDPEVLRRIDELRRTAESFQRGDVVAGKATSIADVTKEIHQALNENRPEFHAIPESRELVAQELLLFENSGSDDLEKIVDPQFRYARLSMKMPMVDGVQYAAYMIGLEERFAPILGDDLTVIRSGLMPIIAGTVHALNLSLVRTYIMALLIITPLMILLIGRLRVGLLSMVPNLVPIVFTLGLMGWVGIPLETFTLLIGCIAIGLAVDDTIHFMHNFRRYFDASGSVSYAVEQTLASTGQALLFTTLVLAAGFFVYMFASISVIVTFGFLTGVTIVSAFLADVVLAPALMALVHRGDEVREMAPGNLEVTT